MFQDTKHFHIKFSGITLRTRVGMGWDNMKWWWWAVKMKLKTHVTI